MSGALPRCVMSRSWGQVLLACIILCRASCNSQELIAASDRFPSTLVDRQARPISPILKVLPPYNLPCLKACTNCWMDPQNDCLADVQGNILDGTSNQAWNQSVITGYYKGPCQLIEWQGMISNLLFFRRAVPTKYGLWCRLLGESECKCKSQKPTSALQTCWGTLHAHHSCPKSYQGASGHKGAL